MNEIMFSDGIAMSGFQNAESRNEKQGMAVDVSHEAGFYTSPINLELSTADSTLDIYYTSDGSDPDTISNKYNGPFVINTTSVIKTIASCKNCDPGPVSTQTYFINENTNLPVISLTTDPHNLWDWYEGIHVMGPNAEPSFPFHGANFWEDWEKPAFIEFFNDEKNLGFALNCGIKIYGAWSRGRDQKSMAIFFRGDYGANELDYKLFPNRIIGTFESFVIRNSGNDFPETTLRDGFMQLLLADLDIDCQAFRPAVIFINGEYWGIQNIREKISEHYVASHHQVDADSIHMLENNMEVIHGDYIHYEQMLDSLNSMDRNSSSTYAFIDRNIDIHEYLNYMISEIYFDNRDWPGNNIKYWRPRAEGGKWRWILFDTDFGYNLYGSDNYAYNSLEDALSSSGPSWPNPPWSTLLLRLLLDNPQFRNQFINHAADLVNTIFLPSRGHALLDSLDAIIRSEIPRHHERWQSDPTIGNAFMNQDRREYHLELIHSFADERPAFFRQHVMDRFGISGTGSLTINADEGGQVKLNSLTLNNFPWQGTYFNGVPVSLQAVSKPGYVFTGWQGSVSSTESHLALDVSGSLALTAHFEINENISEGVVINEINYHSSPDFDPEDWIEICNFGDTLLNLRDWVFRDGNDLHSYVFPEIILQPFSYIVLVEDSSAFSACFPHVTNYTGEFDFGLSGNGELLRLFNADSVLVDSLIYDDTFPWPEEADGHGATLELLNPDYDNRLADNWKASQGYGSPGEVNTVYTSINDDPHNRLPNLFRLYQNYPNPFNSLTTIHFQLVLTSRVTLKIYDLLGNEVAVLVDDEVSAGAQSVQWDASGFPSGMYLCRLKTNNCSETKKLILQK